MSGFAKTDQIAAFQDFNLEAALLDTPSRRHSERARGYPRTRSTNPEGLTVNEAQTATRRGSSSRW